MVKHNGRAGTHTTLTDAARPVAKALEKKARVSYGQINARVGARSLSIKVVPMEGGLKVTVVSKGSRQELHVYGLSLVEAEKILKDPEFSNYHLNVGLE